MSIFFTSDQHFGHTNVIKYCNRPFDTVEQMNEHMVEKWNSVVRPDDVVYVLGDFSLAKSPVMKYVPRLNGQKHLIAGNHDHCHPIHTKNHEKRQRMIQLYLNAGFISVQLEMKLHIAGQSVKLHHMPYNSDHTKDIRYAEYRPKNEGGWLLHGHVHQLWTVNNKQINVGVDRHQYTPVSIAEIEAIIKAHID